MAICFLAYFAFELGTNDTFEFWGDNMFMLMSSSLAACSPTLVFEWTNLSLHKLLIYLNPGFSKRAVY